MNEVAIVELDLAKRVFHLHGAQRDGSVGFRKKLSRGQLLTLLAKELRRYGSLCNRLFWGERDWYARAELRLVPPAYAKPLMKRQKNDAADAEAIAEAASRPTMRFVEPKRERRQARAMVVRCAVHRHHFNIRNA